MIKSSRMRWAGHVVRKRWKRNAYRTSVGKPEEKRPLGRPTRRRDLREIGWGDVDWIDLDQDRDQWWTLVNTVTNIRIPQNIGKFLSSCATDCFS
jgi:hypothetical protein